MKAGWLAVLVAGVAIGRPAAAQVSVYADLSATRLTNLGGTKTGFGPTGGIQAQVAGTKRLKLYGDVRAFYLSAGNMAGGTDNLSMAGVSVGPKVGFQVKRFEPYAEVMVGFARYNDGDNAKASSTTDAQVEVNFGTDFRVSPRFDWRVFEYDYKQYYALGGEFTPKTFSTGVVFHLSKR